MSFSVIGASLSKPHTYVLAVDFSVRLSEAVLSMYGQCHVLRIQPMHVSRPVPRPFVSHILDTNKLTCIKSQSTCHTPAIRAYFPSNSLCSNNRKNITCYLISASGIENTKSGKEQQKHQRKGKADSKPGDCSHHPLRLAPTMLCISCSYGNMPGKLSSTNSKTLTLMLPFQHFWPPTLEWTLLQVIKHWRW